MKLNDMNCSKRCVIDMSLNTEARQQLASKFLMVVTFLFFFLLPLTAWAEPVKVPNLVGKTQTEARLILKNLGLLYEFEEFKECAREKGTIFFQNPKSGTIVEPHFEVFMRTSALEFVQVPQVGNRSYSQYSELLGEIGIGSRVETSFTRLRGPCPLVRDTIETFVGTRPEPGELVCEDASVTIVVNRTEVGTGCHGKVQPGGGCICF